MNTNLWSHVGIRSHVSVLFPSHEKWNYRWKLPKNLRILHRKNVCAIVCVVLTCFVCRNFKFLRHFWWYGHGSSRHDSSRRRCMGKPKAADKVVASEIASSMRHDGLKWIHFPFLHFSTIFWQLLFIFHLYYFLIFLHFMTFYRLYLLICLCLFQHLSSITNWIKFKMTNLVMEKFVWKYQNRKF